MFLGIGEVFSRVSGFGKCRGFCSSWWFGVVEMVLTSSQSLCSLRYDGVG